MNYIQRQIQPLNPQIGFKVNSIQRRIQLLNHQIGFNVNSIQSQIQPFDGLMVESVFEWNLH